jgi:hypothetical protein
MQVRVSLLATLAGFIGCASISAIPAFAADMPTKAKPLAVALQAPAVDGINGKLDGFGGSMGRRNIYGANGSLSIPLQQSFGLQLDGMAGNLDRASLVGAGGHLFWRDPAKGLLGVYGSTSSWNKLGNVSSNHFGLEGGWYLDRLSLEGVAGIENGSSATGIVGGVIQSVNVRSRFFDVVDLNYYLQDNLRLSLGHRYIGGRSAAAVGGELGFGLGGGKMAAVFLEGRIGEGDYRAIWGGVRVYLGQRDKTLIQRHRQDDPPNYLADTSAAFTNSTSETPVPAAPAQDQCQRLDGPVHVQAVCCQAGGLAQLSC